MEPGRPAAETQRVNRTPFVLFAAAALLGTTACGARLDPALRQAAAGQALGLGAHNAGSGQGPVEGSSATASDGRSVGDAAGRSRTAGTSGPGTPGVVAADSGTVGVPLPAEGNGGATDVGVTATSLRIGVIADLAGPVPGLFQGAVAGTQAYVAKVNAEGGIFGRTLKLDVYDSQMDCGQYTAATQSLLRKDFAEVGSFSLYDGCGVAALKASPTFADVHEALQNSAQTSANNFSVAPFERGWRTGPLAYLHKRFGDRFSHIGSIYASVGGGAESWARAKAAVEHEGGHVDIARFLEPKIAKILGIDMSAVPIGPRIVTPLGLWVE